MTIKTLFSQVFIGLELAFLFWVIPLMSDEFPFNPPRNFIFNPKYTVLHHPVATTQILGQLYFDQGLTFTYAFNHDAAYWSFFRAAETDPNMSMAYWGMALVLGSNINIPITPERAKIAYEMIQKAIQKSVNGPENEKAYIQALALRYSKDPNMDQKQLAIQYSQAMKKLSNHYPDDPDAAVLYAESLLNLNPWNQWSIEGKPLEGTMEAVTTLEKVLKRFPDHLGANHYYIHAVEASPYPEIALMSAERLKTLLPSSGHILHMPSHIYLLLGDYEQTVQSNLSAIVADEQYIREYGSIGVYPLHYLSHNFYFLSRAYTLQGRFEDAKQTADRLTTFYVPHFHKMEDLEYYASSPLTVLITFHRWKEILEKSEPRKDMRLTHALWRFGRAMAFANLDDGNQALEQQRLFLEEKKQIGPDQFFGNNTANQILTIADNCLEAKLAEARGNINKAIDFLQKAIDVQDSLKYTEPPDWFFPIRETLGGLLLRLQKPQEAEVVFREELKRHPRSGRALFGLKECLLAQLRNFDAYWVDKEFQEAWRYSTMSLEIKDL